MFVLSTWATDIFIVKQSLAVDMLYQVLVIFFVSFIYRCKKAISRTEE